MITLKKVSKHYSLGKTELKALKQIDLKIGAGEFVAVMGPSGSGKTTLLNIIGCIDLPTDGQCIIDNQNITSLDDQELTHFRLFKLGFIFQSFNLIPVLNVRENIEFPLLLMRRYSKREIRKKVDQLIEEVELVEHSKHRPYELSGGQQQRVAIARALVTQPTIVLADEPTANLDSVTGAKILQVMQKMNVEHRTTFVFSTHDPEVLEYAERKILMRDGVIVSSTETASSA